MKTKLLLCLLAALGSLRAANYVGDQRFAAPFELNESVNIVGNLTFATPGTYSAASWNVVGLVRFAEAGEYTFIATAGGITGSGNVLGPATGMARVHVSYRTSVNFVGVVAANVVLLDDAQSALPPAVNVTIPAPAPLMNVSVRATLGAGGTAIPGFVVGGTGSRRVLIRAIGPALAAFGVASPLANPTFTVFSGSLPVGGNDDWDGSAGLRAAFAAVGAFGLPDGSKDAAVVLTLKPGAYTAVVRGANASDAGEVLVEVYYVE